ncbi:MAG: hypothetical protein ACR2NS_10685 [Gemmatimonadaceae bacterium]
MDARTIADAIASRLVQSTYREGVVGGGNTSAMDGDKVEPRLDLPSWRDQKPDPEILNWKADNADIGVIQAENHSAVDSKLDGAGCASRIALRLSGRSGQAQRGNAQQKKSFHHLIGWVGWGVRPTRAGQKHQLSDDCNRAISQTVMGWQGRGSFLPTQSLLLGH